jgi:hypothetical protein
VVYAANEKRLVLALDDRLPDFLLDVPVRLYVRPVPAACVCAGRLAKLAVPTHRVKLANDLPYQRCAAAWRARPGVRGGTGVPDWGRAGA